jgi:hypothetical protein
METTKPRNLRLLSNKQSKAHAFNVPHATINIKMFLVKQFKNKEDIAEWF